jgi:PD-(D/E)XK endonuclease
MASSGSGNEGEAMVLAALVGRGFRVLVPFGEGHPYDLVVDLDGMSFLRVQCKTSRPQGGCLVFNPHTTDHGRGRQSYLGRADVFGVYFPPGEAVYLVPIRAVTHFSGRLRLESTRNNQRRKIRFAANFEIDRWTVDALLDLVRGGRIRTEPELTLA